MATAWLLLRFAGNGEDDLSSRLGRALCRSVIVEKDGCRMAIALLRWQWVIRTSIGEMTNGRALLCAGGDSGNSDL